jgi:predicted AlkP superfamily pyrophosphatase or phosphodiesterase
MSTDQRREQVLAEMESLDHQWLRASLYLMEKHPADVMMFTFMSIDTVQHYFWQYMDREHHLYDPAATQRFGDAVLRVYQRLDDAVGQLLKKTSGDTSVFVVSDHGGGPTSDRVIYLNRYLASLVCFITMKTTVPRSRSWRKRLSAVPTRCCAAASVTIKRAISLNAFQHCASGSRARSPRFLKSIGHAQKPTAVKYSPRRRASG